jgi:hypothetical protein
MPIWVQISIFLVLLVVTAVLSGMYWPELPVGAIFGGLGGAWFVFVLNQRRRHG